MELWKKSQRLTCQFKSQLHQRIYSPVGTRKEQVCAHKSSDKATGMVCFESRSQVNIMWSAPYRFDFDSIAKSMYYQISFSGLRKKYYSKIEQLEDVCTKYEVLATMGLSNAPEINVNIVPSNYQDLADCIKVHH